MIIGIDARWIFDQLSGIGLHTRELIAHLARIDTENRYVLFFSSEKAMKNVMSRPEIAGNHRFHAHFVPYSPFSPKNQWQMPLVIKKYKLDVFHSTNYMMHLFHRPFFGTHHSCVHIITVHDLIPIKFPHFTPKARKNQLLPLFKWIMRRAIRLSERVIAVSECSKQDILYFSGLSEHDNRVCVVYNGVDDVFQPDINVQKQCEILYVGRLDPYKNVPMLVRAFSRVRQTIPHARLRIIGPDDERYPEARNLIRDNQLGDTVEWTGYVDDDTLLAAYQRASVLALPSRYEGFGLPVVEAMACGTPVVCSCGGSLAEIAGDAALVIPVDDEDALVQALGRVLDDAQLSGEMSDKGRKMIGRYSWDHVAHETLKVYTDAVALK